MKVLLVVYDNESHISQFPIGLAYLASAIRNAHGGNKHTVEVYEQNVYHWQDSHLTAFLDENEYDAVIVSVIGGYYQYKKLLNLSHAINTSKRRDKFKYLIGGHGPAAAPEYFLEKTGADVVGIGEGEITIVELLDAFENNTPLQDVKGIGFIDKESYIYIYSGRRELINNIDLIPFPAYDLFSINHYALLHLPNSSPTDRCLTMLSGRGCIFSCNFCYRLDKGFRPRSAQSIIDEIRFLKEKYAITYIGFYDELLMSSKKRTKELCQAFLDANLNIKWECNGRLNFADIPTLTLMKEAGCTFINYGIESLDNTTLKVMHKALTKKMIIEGIENTLKVGMSPGLNIIYGNINEPLSAIDDAVDFLLKYDDHSQRRTIRPVTPYPGSELFDIAVKSGKIKDVAEFYEKLHTNSDLLCVNFTNNSEEEIYDALYKANKKLLDAYNQSQARKVDELCYNLYVNKDKNFRGFRQT
ncbi:B12-binding domain-containing radical SAM protein [Thomasclavelia cocleata]|jgi:radical SAM superfamily enzyme YgiQ (UPF0313 family)|uniref:B12-binding domain-containing radical SAM protein n=1 Tax=Thomasclavelia cocleata TaxID=69824 RepID=UPI0025A22D10|nr:radical SAM protein [Thomasclavelia cocleata]